MHGGWISWFQGIILSLLEPVRSLVGWHGWSEVFPVVLPVVFPTDWLSVLRQVSTPLALEAWKDLGPPETPGWWLTSLTLGMVKI